MEGHNSKLVSATLPIMQETRRELHRLLDHDATRNPHLQDVLLSDPAVAIAVFRELEHIRPGAFEQVGDAAHAISMIGQEPFRRLLAKLPLLEPPPRAPSSLPGPAVAYSEAAHAAFYAGALGERRGLGGRQELTTAALLQNPAVLALWATETESAQRATNAVRDGVSPSVAFGAELGEPLEQANQRLAEAWALPGLVRQAMGDWDDFNIRPRLVKLADGIAQTTARGWKEDGERAMFNALLSEFLGVDEDGASAWVHQQLGEAARALGHMDYPLPGFEMLFEPGDGIDDGDDDIPEMGRRRRSATDASQAAAVKPRAPDLHTTMADVMQRIRRQAGVGRVVFVMLSRDRKRLRTRLALGGQAEDGIRRLDLGLDEKNLFAALMGKSQSVWLNHDNAGRYGAYLPDTLRRVLGRHGAFMMSLYVNERPLGLMYGDGDNLTGDGYRRFRALCHEATDALGAGSRAASRPA